MIFATAFNISSDLMLLAIPFPIVFKTQLPLKRKIGLCFVLGLGALNVRRRSPTPTHANSPSKVPDLKKLTRAQIIVAILNRYFNFNNPNDLVR